MTTHTDSSIAVAARPDRRNHSGHGWWALLATTFVVLVPSLTVSTVIRLLGTDPSIFVVWGATASMSTALLFIGTAWWMRQPGSTTMSFGELMMWRWIRRQRADERLERGTRVLITESGTDIENTRRGQLKLLRSLNAALETRDPYTRGHARRVERHSYRTALAMQLPMDDIFNLRLAASLHDIGKIRVPIEIIRKQGPLDDSEWAIMKKHSAIGAHIIANIGNPELVGAVRHHHERWDGSGYPDGISGEEIPLHARIIAVCDAFDAITSNRPYRSKSDRKKAISIIKEQSGKQFDPIVARAFLDGLPRGLPGVAALSWMGLPVLRRIASQVGLAVQQAGAFGVAGAIAAGGVTGVVAAEVHPSKYLQRPAVARVQDHASEHKGHSDADRSSVAESLGIDVAAEEASTKMARAAGAALEVGHAGSAHRQSVRSVALTRGKGHAAPKGKGVAKKTTGMVATKSQAAAKSVTSGKAKGKVKQATEAASSEAAATDASHTKVANEHSNESSQKQTSDGTQETGDAVSDTGSEASDNGKSHKPKTSTESVSEEVATTETDVVEDSHGKGKK